MSLYSGFATNKYEAFYDRLTYKLIEILQEQVIKTINPQIAENLQFSKKVMKIQKVLKKLEESRYNNPKDSEISEAFSSLTFILKDMCQPTFE